MPKVVYSFQATITVPFPELAKTRARKAINDALGWVWSETGPVPENVREVHWLLNAGQRVEVTIDVYDDGRRIIRGAGKP